MQPSVIEAAEARSFVVLDGPQATETPPPAPFAPSFLQTAQHPTICICHIGFKLLSILSFTFGSFIFGGWRGDYVCTFIATTILLSMDFWVVKNVTGRLLVGMRWWHRVNDDGTSEWVYESHADERVINATDKAVFWVALYLWPALWALLVFWYLLRFEVEWVLLVGIAVALGGANLVGYWNCSKEAKSRMQQWATTSSALRALFSRFV